MSIGFNGMRRARIIGTEFMGAISNFQFTETEIGFQFPTKRLVHINRTPRENFLPEILTYNSEQTI